MVTMVVGILLIHLYLPESGSLKAKRRIIQSLKATLRNRFNVSIAEIDRLDSIKDAEIGISCISNNGKYVDGQFSKIMEKINSDPRVEVIDYSTEKI